MSDIITRIEADRDVLRLVRYFRRHARPKTAEKYLERLEVTLKRLASQPGIGVRYPNQNPRLKSVRFAPVDRFPKILLFYREFSEGGIELLRVFHAARDITEWAKGLPSEE